LSLFCAIFDYFYFNIFSKSQEVSVLYFVGYADFKRLRLDPWAMEN